MKVEIHQGPPPSRGEPFYLAEFPGAPEEKNRVIGELLCALSGGDGVDAKGAFRLRLCLDEAIQNAISHGNADDPRKLVQVSAYQIDGGWEVAVRDQGRGFKLKDVPDPRHSQSLHKEGGRGLLILTEYMDGVHYYEGGRTLVLTRLSGQRDAF